MRPRPDFTLDAPNVGPAIGAALRAARPRPRPDRVLPGGAPQPVLQLGGIRLLWWGGPPGPRGTPASRCRNNEIGILQGASRPTGASAADRGVRPTVGHVGHLTTVESRCASQIRPS